MNETKPLRIVHYLNQFFAGIGGEDKAGIGPYSVDGAIGPGMLLEQYLGINIVGTVVCGDNHFVEEPVALEEILKLIQQYKPDGIIAGPAFAAGRYGEACAAICLEVQTRLGIQVITGLAPESPSVDSYRKKVNIFRTGSSARDMRKSLPKMGEILRQLIQDGNVKDNDREYLYPQGLKENQVLEKNAAQRAISMLLAKYNGESWKSELTFQEYEMITPAPPVMEKPFTVALLTDGGLVLKGNPEGMSSGRSKRWCRIDVDSWNKLTPDRVEVTHFGYDNRFVLSEPNRLVPLDVLRNLENQGEVKVHSYIYSTAGVSTTIENGSRFGQEIAKELQLAGVQAAILTST